MDISVIIPAYNVENYLPQALDSILNQDFDGTFEILIANDASTDGSLGVIRRYEQEYPQMIRELNRAENMGVSANYVDLAQMSNAKYLAFCDADDYWTDTHKLQKQYDYLESHPEIGMVCAAANVIDDKGAFKRRVDVEYATSLLSLLESEEDIFCSNIVCCRELFLSMTDECAWYIERNWFYDTIWAYWFAAHSTIGYMPEVLSAYRVSEDSDSHSSDVERSYQLVKRNYMIKMHFMLGMLSLYTHTQGAPREAFETILEQEYDYMFSYAIKTAKEEVYKSKTYRIGKIIKKLFGKSG